MNFDGRLFLAAAIILVLAPSAQCLEIGGGAGALAGTDSSVLGSFAADGIGASSAVSATGSIPHAGEVRFVQDDAGKRSEISFNVTGASGGIKYSASFSPKEGRLGKIVPSISASQTLTIPART